MKQLKVEPLVQGQAQAQAQGVQSILSSLVFRLHKPKETLKLQKETLKL